MSSALPQISPVPSNQSVVGRLRQWLRHVLGVDRAVGFTVLARFWSSSAGLVTVALIARFLSPAEQGYYYTFGSLVAMQMVFELGFSFVILQLASHERAQLSISSSYEITGDTIAHARLASVVQKSVRWYSVAAALLALTLLPVGFYFFHTHQQGQAVSWFSPWCLDAVMAVVNFQVDPLLSFLEGCGYVANVARLRFVQPVTGSFLAWMALISHHGLFAPAMMLLGMAFCFGQYRAWLDLRAQGIYLATNPNSSFFYVLTFMHALHVLAGLSALAYLGYRLRAMPKAFRRSIFENTAIYWHFMAALWVYLLLLCRAEL